MVITTVNIPVVSIVTLHTMDTNLNWVVTDDNIIEALIATKALELGYDEDDFEVDDARVFENYFSLVHEIDVIEKYADEEHVKENSAAYKAILKSVPIEDQAAPSYNAFKESFLEIAKTLRGTDMGKELHHEVVYGLRYALEHEPSTAGADEIKAEMKEWN